MRPAVIISWLLVDTVLQTGLAALIQTQQTVLAAVGEDAPLSCLLLETKDVQQVTWQKLLGNKERNIGSYSEYFGQTVNLDFKDKVQFIEAGLQKTSIVIRNVTEQDEGCYFCRFITELDGALTAGTCLKVYELHGPVLDVSRSSSPAGSVVSCSATGRPAPTVTLTAPQQNLSLSLYNTTRVSNSNGTVTVTTTALLSASSSTQVGCSVSVLSAAPRELLLNVPGPSHTSGHGLDEDSGTDHRELGWRVGVALGLLSGASVVALFSIWCMKKRHRNSKLQKKEKPEEETRNPQSEEQQMPKQKTEETTSVLIYRQSCKSPRSPTTPDIESCGPDGINLHKKLISKKST
ncbi:OX-2 membrane glycoprotein isoform X3 [Fundulus heteroclitus]|uniref:OX-2 membrane glycoprotein isoform X3 n=1 Tax=Fundulus heteroclitus TaxID=8078 RepID=UPI00165A2A07|nr:OX-2 membrane glycoprotein isoform X3 [Fundulus heteroclitus]